MIADTGPNSDGILASNKFSLTAFERKPSLLRNKAEAVRPSTAMQATARAMSPDSFSACFFFSLSLSPFRWPVTHVPGSPGTASRPDSASATEARRREESAQPAPWPRPGTPGPPMEAGGGWSLLAASLSLSVPGLWRGKGAASCLSDLFAVLLHFFYFFFFSLGRGFGISPDIPQLQGLFWLATNLSVANFLKAPWNP